MPRRPRFNARQAASVLQLEEAEYHAWLRRNRKSLGGTAMAALLGVSQWSNPQRVFDELLELVPDRRSAAMERGNALEPIIANIYARKTGRRVRNVPLSWHPRIPYLHARPDRAILSPQGDFVRKGPGILEIKSMGQENYRATREDGIDQGYYVQLQTYIDVRGYTWGAFAAHNAEDWVLWHRDVDRDEAVIRQIHEAARWFWNDHVLPRLRPPSPVPPEEASVPVVGGEAVRRDDREWKTAVRNLREAKNEFAIAERRKKLAEARVKELIGGHTLVIGGGARCSFPEVTRRTFDVERFAHAYPDMDLEPYYNTTAYRRLTFSPDGNR